MEVAKKNVRSIAIAAGVAAGILGLYVIYKRRSTKSRPMTDKEKDAMISKIKITYNGRILSVDTVVEIFEVASTITVSDTLSIKSELQKARRKNKGNFAQYAKTCEEYIQKSDAISVQWEKETQRRLGISEDLLQQSILHYQYQNDPKLRALSTKLSEDRANVRESRKAVSFETFKPFVKRLVELFEAEVSSLSTTKTLIKNPIYVAHIINYKVYDVIFDEFGLSDEDIYVALATHIQKLSIEDRETFLRFLKASQVIELGK